MSNQPLYPAQQNPSHSPNEANPVSNNAENSQPSSNSDYNRDYPVQTPQPSSYENVGNNDPYYSNPQQSANSYSSPNFSNDPYTASNPDSNTNEEPPAYLNQMHSGQSYQQTSDPYAPSAASANGGYESNSWQNQSYGNTRQQQDPQQQGYPQQNYQQSQDLNIKALLGLIFSFFFFPAGLILSWMGFRETKNTSDNTGRIMSIIGLVVSGFQTALFILWVVLFIFLMLLGMSGV